jgi:hypothetical protein
LGGIEEVGGRGVIPRMASVKKDHLTATGEWAKHLRRQKRAYWNAERKAARNALRSMVPVDLALQ